MTSCRKALTLGSVPHHDWPCPAERPVADVSGWTTT
jgi:hypothetical protein